MSSPTGSCRKRRLFDATALGLGLSVLCFSLFAETRRSGPYYIRSAPPVASKSVPFTVREPGQVDRSQWPVRGSIPIPRGELRDASRVRLLDAGKREIPVQTEVLGWWPTIDRKERKAERSVMWLCLTFLTDLKAGEKADFVLEYGTDIKPSARPSHPVSVKKMDDRVSMTNGLATLTLNSSAEYIESIRLGNTPVVTNGNTDMALDISYKHGTRDWLPRVVVPEIKSTPTVDGKLNDDIWKRARKVSLTRFRLAGNPAYPTRALMAVDKQNLYLAFDCEDSAPKAIKGQQRDPALLDIYTDDHVRVWLAPSVSGMSSFCELTINSAGSLRTRKIPTRKISQSGTPAYYDARLTVDGLQHRTGRTDSGWQVEMAIPLASLKLDAQWWENYSLWSADSVCLASQTDHAGSIGVQLYRYRPARKGQSGGEESRWPMSLAFGHEHPSKFARIPDPSGGTEKKGKGLEGETLYKERPARQVQVKPNGPELDGKLDEPFWKDLKPLAFRYMSGIPSTPTQKTDSWIASTKDAIYVAVHCADSHMKSIRAREKARDNEVWSDDCVEIFLKAGEKPTSAYHQISFNSLGTIYDGYNRNKLWNGNGIRTAVARDNGSWTVEIKIPFGDLVVPEGLDRSKGWRFNIVRTRRKRRYKDPKGNWAYTRHEETVWSPTRSNSSHVPTMFGYLFFDAFGGRMPEPDPKDLAKPKGPTDLDKLIEGRVESRTETARVEVREQVVEVEGPVVSVIRVRGYYRHGKTMGSPFTARFHMYAGRKDVRLFHTMTTGFETYRARMKRVSLNLPCKTAGGAAAALVSGKAVTVEAGADVVQYRDDSYAVFRDGQEKVLQGRLNGSLQVKTAAGRLNVAGKDFWQLHPGGFQCAKNGIRFDFYSPKAVPFYFGVTGELRDDYGGFSTQVHREPQRVSRTHEAWIGLEGKETDYGKLVQHRLLPYAGKQWNADSLAMGMIAPYDRDILTVVEDFNDYQLWWFVNEQRQQKWYGWGFYGNTLNSLTGRGVHHAIKNPYDVGYIRKGGYGWANDRKNISLCYLHQYFRSGRRIWFDFGEASTRNSTDICTSFPVLSDQKPWPSWANNNYCDPDKCNHDREDRIRGYRRISFRAICRPRRHTQQPWASNRGSAARQGGQPGWVLYYFLTGDRRTRDVIEMRDLHLTTKGYACTSGGGMCTSSPHGTRAQERRFLVLRWTMTDDPLYSRLIDGFHRNCYARILEDNAAVISMRYPWYVAPDKAWMWAKGSEVPARPGKLRGAISGMHTELGGWDGPARYCQLTGDAWLARALYRLGGWRPTEAAKEASPQSNPKRRRPKGRAPDKEQRPKVAYTVGGKRGRHVPRWGMLFNLSYNAPFPVYADRLAWGDMGMLRSLATVSNLDDLKSCALNGPSRTPVKPAEPEGSVDPLDLYTYMVEKLGIFPASYLWPSGNYYRSFALYPLQQLLRTGTPMGDLERLGLEPVLEENKQPMKTGEEEKPSPTWTPVYQWGFNLTPPKENVCEKP